MSQDTAFTKTFNGRLQAQRIMTEFTNTSTTNTNNPISDTIDTAAPDAVTVPDMRDNFSDEFNELRQAALQNLDNGNFNAVKSIRDHVAQIAKQMMQSDDGLDNLLSKPPGKKSTTCEPPSKTNKWQTDRHASFNIKY
ncbi:Hypothetical predicted protein [Lecanosticta acicola]|uniref:Uncharacterized protein n=1 Tax=Lecanosticta acicola TaxID=111012 RepID=A0AAI9ED37_9PEZI|nr:Hypothetical predicted protein [Lecanosticta acicola]